MGYSTGYTMAETDRFTFTTSLWKRSQNSYASTIPQSVLALSSAPTGDDAVVRWRVESDTGRIYVEFDTEEDEAA